jgi:hypothetical protein
MLWPTPGLFVFLKLTALGMVGFLGYWWLGEFCIEEIAVLRSFLLPKSDEVKVA